MRLNLIKKVLSACIQNRNVSVGYSQVQDDRVIVLTLGF